MKIKIGKACTPSTILSTNKIEGIKVLISYGNDIKTYHCVKVQRTTEFKKLPLDFWELTLLTGKVIEVNPKFIVEISNKNIIKILSDITAHKNYSKTTSERCILTEYIELRSNEEAVFVDEYTSRDESLILKYEE